MTAPSESFSVEAIDGQSFFTFPELPKGTSGIGLRSIVRNFTSNPGLKGIPASILYNALGRFRSLNYFLELYNQQRGSEDPFFVRYVQTYVLQLVSGFGFQISRPDESIQVLGLKEFIKALEDLFQAQIKEQRTAISQNIVTFESLQELYLPGRVVAGMTSCGVLSGFRVVHCFYEERRSLRGMEKSFHLQLEYLSTVGKYFALITFEEVLSGWMGTRTRAISELPYFPATKDQLEIFKNRGLMLEKVVSVEKGHSFLAYDGGSFVIHGNLVGANNLRTMSGSLVNSSGRMVVDVSRGSSLGHYPTNGMEEPSHAMINLVGRYRRACLANSDSGPTQDSSNKSSEGFVLFEKLPEVFLSVTWPAVVGFSFTLKSWGHVLVSGIREIVFNDRAFDQLVLDPGRKQLIKALVRFGGGGSNKGGQVDDIIAGKNSGSIFLLHGPPGVGKTLTAEAIAEVLHRPIYYVSMGELGTEPETVETRLRDILSLCEGWNALTLIDEADVFLEKRQLSDLVRNAIVCVLLRLIEYHPGILFLTTNRVREFDPAFESRVTVALRYEPLDKQSRAEVWKTLVGRISTSIEVGNLDWVRLAEHEFNGRQINNAIRLSLALALDADTSLSQEIIEKTIKIMETGRSDMRTAEKF